jgi:FkbM family methyltransferase
MYQGQIPNFDDYISFIESPGFFVEIGAYDGITHSNTHHLVQNGWKGLYVEPIKEYYNACVETHKDKEGVSIYNYLISDYDGIGRIFKAGEGSSADEDTIDFMIKNDMRWATNASDKVVEELSCLKLSSFLEKVKCPNDIDLLVIDTESYEWKVIKTLDLKKYNVKCIVIELHENEHTWQSLGIQAKNVRLVNEMMEKNNYKKIFSDPINTIFVKK